MYNQTIKKYSCRRIVTPCILRTA